MDGQRFDDVTRALAAGAPRRAVLRAALGGIGAGVLALMGSIDASAKGSGEASDAGPVPCGDVPGLECSEGFTCVDGFCLADTGTLGTLDCIDDCFERFGPGLAQGHCISACARDADEAFDTPVVTVCGQGLFLTICDEGEYCCNESCGICAPRGGFCTQEFCGPS